MKRIFPEMLAFLFFINAGFMMEKDLKLVQSRQEVIDSYKKFILNTEVKDLQWNGSIENCMSGVISEEIKNKVLLRINYLRSFSGLSPVNLDEDYNKEAQEAAFLMEVNKQLSHSPDPNWNCYNDLGRQGAARSNLSYGAHSSRALMSQMEDNGYSNYSVGHRRYILQPFAVSFGLGSTNNTMALLVLGKKDYSKKIPDYVPWPPEGFVPSPLVYARWSFSIHNADFSNSSIQMKLKNGKTVSLEKEKLYNGYGDNTLVWVPELDVSDIEEDLSVKVKITNVMKKGEKKDYEYEVIIIGSEGLR